MFGKVTTEEVRNNTLIVYDKVNYSSHIEAINSKFFLKNNISTRDLNFFNVLNYRWCEFKDLFKINKNLILSWQYYGIDSFCLRELGVNSGFENDINLTPEVLLKNMISVLLNDLDCELDLNGELFSENRMSLIDHSYVMRNEMRGTASIMGFSLNKWALIMGVQTSNFSRLVISTKISEF